MNLQRDNKHQCESRNQLIICGQMGTIWILGQQIANSVFGGFQNFGIMAI